MTVTMEKPQKPEGAKCNCPGGECRYLNCRTVGRCLQPQKGVTVPAGGYDVKEKG